MIKRQRADSRRDGGRNDMSVSAIRDHGRLNRLARPAVMLVVAAAAIWFGSQAGLAFVGIVRDSGTPVALLAQTYPDRKAKLIALGELAFKARATLGESNFSCDTCHPDGGASQRLFFPGLSDKPGNIDVTNQVLTHFEDGIYNPINIPSLLGGRDTPPFGRDGRFESIRDFTMFAIVSEFAGPDPSDLVLDALTLFQEELPFPYNPLIGPDGRLTGAAPAAARRGEAIFLRTDPETPVRSCATCHRPETRFRDGRTYDVGTGREGKLGKAFETPTLLGTVGSAPYFHDGRYDRLDQVVAYFNRHFDLGLSAAQKADLTRYLEVIGGGKQPTAGSRTRLYPAAAADLLALTVAEEDYFLSHLVVEQAAIELDMLRGRRGAPELATITVWIQALRQVQPAVTLGQWATARAHVDAYRRLVDGFVMTGLPPR